MDIADAAVRTAGKQARALRIAAAADTNIVVAMLRMAGAGLLEELLEEAVRGIDTDTLLALAVSDPGSALFFENAILLERDGVACGMILACDGDVPLLPHALTTLIPRDRLHSVTFFASAPSPGTMYVAALAVRPGARRRGGGMTLLRAVGELARAEGFDQVGLHVRADNAPALALYRRCGFVRRLPADGTDLSSEMWLMTASAARLAASE